ncbi:MAG: STM3941 family protein [Thermomonas sp.]
MIQAMPALPLELSPSRWKYALLLATSLGFVAIGVFLLPRGQALPAWGCIVFFGLCALVFAASLLPNASGLRLDEDGFVVRSLFRSHRTQWTQVAAFRPVRIGNRTLVGFDYAPSAAGPGTRMRGVSSALAGVEGAFPDNYGLPARELADLLNGLLATRR